MKEAYKELGYNKANYVPLTPLSFLHRTADIYGEREAIIYGDKRYNWRPVSYTHLTLPTILRV